jgi:hypothetical protein
MMHPGLRSLLAEERARELHEAADRYRRARSLTRGMRVVRLRSPVVGSRGPTVVRLRWPLAIARTDAQAGCG